jgi:integrase
VTFPHLPRSEQFNGLSGSRCSFEIALLVRGLSYLVVSPGGQRRWVRKSTKKRKRSEAKEILDTWQNTADRAAAGNLDQARIREIVLETVERVTGKRTDAPTVSEWLERWIRTERGAVAQGTIMRYEQIVRDFLSSIGTQAQAPLEALSTDTFLEFKERWLSGGRSPRTVNQTIKILKRPFKIALEQGLIDRNPVAAVRPIRTSSAKKDVFSPEQIQHLLEVAKGDRKGLILSGYFTGGRLVDLARLTWADIDLSEKTITFVQRKTGSSVLIPIHQDLYEYFLELPRSDRTKRPVFPKLFEKPGAGKSGLSMSFKRLMERAGIDDGVARRSLRARVMRMVRSKGWRNVVLLQKEPSPTAMKVLRSRPWESKSWRSSRSISTKAVERLCAFLAWR